MPNFVRANLVFERASNARNCRQSGTPVAMGYVSACHSATGTRLFAELRGARLPVHVAALPFITPGYKR